MAKTLKEMLVPILFLVEGAFWLAIVATGGGFLLIFAALAGILSGVLLIAVPSSWAAKPLAGASALFALVLAVYQVYVGATLVGSNLATVGLTNDLVFGVFAVVSVYLELATLSMRSEAAVSSQA